MDCEARECVSGGIWVYETNSKREETVVVVFGVFLVCSAPYLPKWFKGGQMVNQRQGDGHTRLTDSCMEQRIARQKSYCSKNC